MTDRRWRGWASSLLATGLLLMMMSMGGNWGTVYGQSGGPTPTPDVSAVAPDTGAEGEDEGREEAVAGESAEAGDAAEQPEAVAGESGDADIAAALPSSGAEAAVQWPLLVAGVVLFVSGAVIFRRTRKFQS
jgi:hypothetical protein